MHWYFIIPLVDDSAPDLHPRQKVVNVGGNADKIHSTGSAKGIAGRSVSFDAAQIVVLVCAP
jgi:hypothetical protein